MSRYRISYYNNGPVAFDPNNKITGPNLKAYQPKLGASLTQQVKGVSATIGGAAVSAAATTRIFSPNKATYRDISAAGSWIFTETDPGDPAPAVPAGALRVGVTLASNSTLVQDTLLCSWFKASQDVEEPSQEAAQAMGDQGAADLAQQEGGAWTAIVQAL